MKKIKLLVIALVSISTIGIFSQCIASTKVYELKDGETCENVSMSMNFDNELNEAVRIKFTGNVGGCMDKVPYIPLDLEKVDSPRHTETDEYICKSKDICDVEAVAKSETKNLCVIEFGCSCLDGNQGCQLFVTTKPVFFFNRCESEPDNRNGYKIVFNKN